MLISAVLQFESQTTASDVQPRTSPVLCASIHVVRSTARTLLVQVTEAVGVQELLESLTWRVRTRGFLDT